MSARLSAARMLSAPDDWNRRRLQVLFVVVGVVASAVVGGVVWSVVELLGRGGNDSRSSRSGGVAGQPFVVSTPPIEAAQPGPLSSGDTGSIKVPQPSRIGETQVGSGFPRTPEGALGQLIAIDQRALESSSVVTAQDVIAAWAAAGGPTPASWSGVAAVQALLESAGLPANGSSELTIQLNPVMGRVDGDSTVTTACVDFVVSATVTGGQPSRIAVADCQHMVWQSGRWMIAPGDEAPAMPSLWPGTQASHDAGYLWLEIQP